MEPPPPPPSNVYPVGDDVPSPARDERKPWLRGSIASSVQLPSTDVPENTKLPQRVQPPPTNVPKNVSDLVDEAFNDMGDLWKNQKIMELYNDVKRELHGPDHKDKTSLTNWLGVAKRALKRLAGLLETTITNYNEVHGQTSSLQSGKPWAAKCVEMIESAYWDGLTHFQSGYTEKLNNLTNISDYSKAFVKFVLSISPDDTTTEIATPMLMKWNLELDAKWERLLQKASQPGVPYLDSEIDSLSKCLDSHHVEQPDLRLEPFKESRGMAAWPGRGGGWRERGGGERCSGCDGWCDGCDGVKSGRCRCA